MNTIFESTEEIYGKLPEAWQLTTLGELIKNKKSFTAQFLKEELKNSKAKK